ncbi:MAG: hypothetical protein A2036_04135 [Omnitrophica bacterium GWA2_50_21]|nr:MAG: hypothetical protein A2036_04135 [Omnitrophica bacterium GWA2_50_21]
MNKTVLVVDDDKRIANLISIRLKKEGYSPVSVFDGRGALEWIERQPAGLVMLDIRLPDMSGVEVLREALKKRPGTCVIMISAHSDVKMAVECIKIGAFDFLEKPFEFAAFDAKVKHVFRQMSLEEEVSTLKTELGDSYKDKSLIGKSDSMLKVFQLMDLAAKSDVNVLIHGESGTGKELVSRAIHLNSLQSQGPFVAVNCGAIPENLIESELFGHEKGAFTGAVSRKIGKFEQAQGGTIFLDEIGDLPLALQVKLLRVLQEREVERVGGGQPVPVQIRFVTATNQDLKAMVSDGKFREDLYYRINVFPIRIPPLRERKADIPELFLHFVKKNRNGKPSLKTDEKALRCLCDYDWPGNVRELENFVARLMLLVEDKNIVTEKDIYAMAAFGDDASKKDPVPLNDRASVMGEAERKLLEKALQEAGGNVTKASKALQMSRDSFYRKMKKYQMAR